MPYYDEATLHFDGACKNNPSGKAGCGWTLKNDADDTTIAKGRRYLGSSGYTNNVAEYFGLIEGLKYARSQRMRFCKLNVKGDSDLVVKQLGGSYKVRSGRLRPLHSRARDMLGKHDDYALEHVGRNENADADELANDAIWYESDDVSEYWHDGSSREYASEISYGYGGSDRDYSCGEDTSNRGSYRSGDHESDRSSEDPHRDYSSNAWDASDGTNSYCDSVNKIVDEHNSVTSASFSCNSNNGNGSACSVGGGEDLSYGDHGDDEDPSDAESSGNADVFDGTNSDCDNVTESVGENNSVASASFSCNSNNGHGSACSVDWGEDLSYGDDENDSYSWASSYSSGGYSD